MAAIWQFTGRAAIRSIVITDLEMQRGRSLGAQSPLLICRKRRVQQSQMILYAVPCCVVMRHPAPAGGTKVYQLCNASLAAIPG